MDPAAVVERVILLVQHEYLALVPTLVLRAHLLQPQRCFVMKAGPAWENTVDREPSEPSGQTKSISILTPPAKDQGIHHNRQNASHGWVTKCTQQPTIDKK